VRGRLKLYAVAVGVATAVGVFLSCVYAMPAFTLLTCPGVVFGLMAAGNTPANNNFLIFFGNWIFYSLVFVAVVECVLIFKRRSSQ